MGGTRIFIMLSDELKAGLNVALNEATLLGFELDPTRALAGATLSVLMLPPDAGPMPADSRVQLLFAPVGRVAVSLRAGRWDDATAPVLPVGTETLLETVQSFGGLPVYGWEFLDVAEREMSKWGDRLSLDWRGAPEHGLRHSLLLFQEGGDRHLDLCVWFDTLEARWPDGSPVALSELAAGGKRWWDAFYAHDPRTQGLGIVPMK